MARGRGGRVVEVGVHLQRCDDDAAHLGDSARGAPSGSYQLNPPFSAPLYAALVQHCKDLLEQADASGTPLSFVLIIGATAPALALPCIATLATSPFYRGRLVVGVSEHVYVCGRQFMKPDAATFRACDTGCFFLQSAAAAKAWPVTDAKLAKLRAAFEATNGYFYKYAKMAGTRTNAAGIKVEIPDTTPVHTDYLKFAVEKGVLSQSELDAV